MSDSRYWSATECASALRRGDVSAVELVDEAIARIEALNPRLNIVVATAYERARSKATAADAALAAGESVGPLHGLPITVKDSFERPTWSPPAERRSSAITYRTPTPWPCNASPRPAPSSWARPTCRYSQVTSRATTTSTASPGNHGIRNEPWVAPPVALRLRWPQDSSLLRSAATSPAPSAYRRTSAACTATSRRTASSRCADIYWVRRGNWRLPTSWWPASASRRSRPGCEMPSHLPATSAPVGMTPEGLPVNVQIIGDYLDEQTTIHFAELLAEVRGGFQPPPLPPR